MTQWVFTYVYPSPRTRYRTFLSARTWFLSLYCTDIWSGTFLCWEGLSCALQGVNLDPSHHPHIASHLSFVSWMFAHFGCVHPFPSHHIPHLLQLPIYSLFFFCLVLLQLFVVVVFDHTTQHVELPRPGMEPTCPAVEGQSLNHWTTREVLVSVLLNMVCLDFMWDHTVLVSLCLTFHLTWYPSGAPMVSQMTRFALFMTEWYSTVCVMLF